MKKYLSIAILPLMLTACGSEPSDSDIKAIFAEGMMNFNSQMAARGDDEMNDAIKDYMNSISVKKIGDCVKTDAEGKRFECPIEYETGDFAINGQVLVPAQRGKQTAVLIKTDSGWAAR